MASLPKPIQQVNMCSLELKNSKVNFVQRALRSNTVTHHSKIKSMKYLEIVGWIDKL